GTPGPRGTLGARAAQDAHRGDAGGVPRRVERQLRMSGGADRHARMLARLRAHAIPLAREREAEDVEPGPQVRDGRRRAREGDHGRASSRMSLSTPAAVTAGPAPEPLITSGFSR